MLKNGFKTVVIPINVSDYKDKLNSRKSFKSYLDQTIEQYPELFPIEIESGYDFQGWSSAFYKMPIKRRIIQLKKTRSKFLIHPCFILPYLSGNTIEISKGLRLRKDNVSYDTIAQTFGRNAMFWYRLEMSLARNNIVATTVRSASKMPKHILVDEHHNRLNGEKIYICTTVAADCFLGAEITPGVSSEELKEAYQVFQSESVMRFSDYKVLTINIDGFKSTTKAIKQIHPRAVAITCFLHACLKIQTNLKRDNQAIADVILNKAWHCYRAENKQIFAQRIRRFQEMAEQCLLDGNLKESILKLCSKKDLYIKAYDFQNCHRTSNMLDRLMKFQNRRLDNTQHFRGNLTSANNAMRAHALLVNFCPYSTNTIIANGGITSPFEKLNGFKYRENWLENLLVASSLNGYHINEINSR